MLLTLIQHIANAIKKFGICRYEDNIARYRIISDAVFDVQKVVVRSKNNTKILTKTIQEVY
jgi:hypothetical protein